MVKDSSLGNSGSEQAYFQFDLAMPGLFGLVNRVMQFF